MQVSSLPNATALTGQGPPAASQSTSASLPPNNLPPGELSEGGSSMLVQHRVLRLGRENWARTRQQELRHFIADRVEALSTPEHIKVALSKFCLELTRWKPSVREATEAILYLLPSERMLLVIHLKEILAGTQLSVDWQENAIVISQKCTHSGLFSELRLLPNRPIVQKTRFFEIEARYKKVEESELDSSTFAKFSLSLLGV